MSHLVLLGIMAMIYLFNEWRKKTRSGSQQCANCCWAGSKDELDIKGTCPLCHMDSINEKTAYK